MYLVASVLTALLVHHDRSQGDYVEALPQPPLYANGTQIFCPNGQSDCPANSLCFSKLFNQW